MVNFSSLNPGNYPFEGTGNQNRAKRVEKQDALCNKMLNKMADGNDRDPSSTNKENVSHMGKI